MEFQELPARIDGELTHVNDLVEADRLEVRRRLDFLAAKLGNSALQEVVLGEELDALSQNNFDLAA